MISRWQTPLWLGDIGPDIDTGILTLWGGGGQQLPGDIYSYRGCPLFRAATFNLGTREKSQDNKVVKERGKLENRSRLLLTLLF